MTTQHRIIVAAFSRGGSTFTATNIAKYLGCGWYNEPECHDGLWHHLPTQPFEDVIDMDKKYEPTGAWKNNIVKSNILIKTNYYTRILHLLDIPEDFKIIFVVRNPVEQAHSDNRFFSFGKNHTYHLQRKEFMVEGQKDRIHYLMDTWIDIVNYMIDYSKTRSCMFLRYDEYVSNPEVLKSKLDKFLGTDNEMHDYAKEHKLKSYPKNDYRIDEINKLWEYMDEYNK